MSSRWDGPPTVDGEFDGYASDAADGVVRSAGVHVVVRHQHTQDGQDLLVMRQLQPRVVGKHLSPLQPTVDGLGTVVVGTVQVKVLAVLQDR